MIDNVVSSEHLQGYAAESASSGKVSSAPQREEVHHLSRSTGAIRIIAVSRLILSGYWILAFLLDPPDTLIAPTVTLGLIYAYAGYALVRAAMAWRSPYSSRRAQILRHVGDLAVFGALSMLTSGSTSPFFLGLLYSLVCSALLFNLRGMLWTAGGSIAMYVALTFMAEAAPDFALYRFVVRTGFLAAIAALVIQLKLHEERLQSDYKQLAGWPRGSMVTLSAMIGEILEHAAQLLRVPRILVVWENEDAPVLHVAMASDQGVTVTEEPLSRFDPVVDPSGRLQSFVSTRWLRSPAARTGSSAPGLQPMNSNPLHPAFREHFGIDHVVASRFTGENASGWLFVLDKHDLAEDDLVLTDIVAGLIQSRLEQFYLAATVRETAVSQERVRFARDLHDGILQSLSGTAFHLQCLRHLIENDVEAALSSLGDVQQALQTDQREVRSFIMKLRSTVDSEDEPRLTPRLHALAERIQREWGLKVTVEANPLIEIVGPGMAEEIYRVVKEGLTNAALHSHAARVSVAVTIRNERAHIIIEDNGRGFTFSGRHNLEALTAMRRGPVTLKERVTALGGDLIIESNEDGARLEIELATSL